MNTIAIIAITVVVTFTLGTITMLIHEIGHGLTAWFLGAKINRISIGVVKIISFNIGQTKFSFGILPFWSITDINVESMPPTTYILILIAGGVLNFLAGIFFATMLPGGLASLPNCTMSLISGNSVYEEAITLLSLFNISAAMLNLLPFPYSDGFNILAELFRKPPSG